jgi:N utilization substance protein B
MTQLNPSRKPSAKARKMSARLLAVQAVYQASLNEQDLKSAAKEYLEYRVGMEIDGEEIVEPDKVLFSAILAGVDERRNDLGDIIAANIKDGGDKAEVLIKAILMCAAFELLAHHDIDSPIIINDYVNVAHTFFEKGEVSLINAILDKVSGLLRVS